MKLLLTVVTGRITYVNTLLESFCLVTEHEVPEGVDLKQFLVEKIREAKKHEKSQDNFLSVSHSFIP